MEVTTKRKALEVIEQMPADASYEDMMYELYILLRIQQGIEDIEAGRTISQEEMEREFVEWRRSAGL